MKRPTVRERAVDLVATLRRRDAYAADLRVLANPEVLGRLDLIVNSTSTTLGGGALPRIDFALTPRRLVACDLMYGGKRSPFLEQARGADRRTLDGSGMPLHQGALAFTLWTGVAGPRAGKRRSRARPP